MGYLNLVRPVLHQLKEDVAHRLTGAPLALAAHCPGCSQPVIQQFSKKSGDAYWVHHTPEHADACVRYLNDDGNAPAMPAPEITDACPNCQHVVIRKINKRKSPYWVHQDRDHATPCGHTFLNDRDGVPELKPEVQEAPCPACDRPVLRRYSDKTQGHFWVHKAKTSKCPNKFLDDVEGVPALKG